MKTPGKFILTAFLVLLVQTSITCTMQATNKTQTPKAKKTTMKIVPDQIVKNIYGDVIADIIFSPKEVKLYKLISNVQPSDEDITIGGHKVEKELGKIPRDYYPILQFLLADSCSYSDGTLIPAMPFSPTYAVEFSKKGNTVFLVFSFDNREIAIVCNGIELKRQQIRIPRKLMLFVKGLDDDNFLKEQLKNAKQ